MTAFVVMGVVSALALTWLVVSLRSTRERRTAAAATTALRVDDEGIERQLADGRRESVAWGDVAEVEVITTDVGVHREDGALIVLGVDETRGCIVPSRLAAEHGVIDRLTQLPGFEYRRLADALDLAPPSRTTCWTRPRP